MHRALKEAERAAAGGDIPVGALIVAQNGRILSVAANRVERDHNPVAHAEILAIIAAAQLLGSSRIKNALMVATLEPCCMCVGAIAHARIAGLVYGAADPRAGAIQSSADVGCLPLGGRSFWHMGGIESRPCAALLNNFFNKLRNAAF